MSGERADGFWWVREGDAWAVVEVRNGRVRWPGLATDTWGVDALGIEWGPYIGKEPFVVQGTDASADGLRGLTFGGMLHTLELAGVLTNEQVEVLQAAALCEVTP